MFAKDIRTLAKAVVLICALISPNMSQAEDMQVAFYASTYGNLKSFARKLDNEDVGVRVFQSKDSAISGGMVYRYVAPDYTFVLNVPPYIEEGEHNSIIYSPADMTVDILTTNERSQPPYLVLQGTPVFQLAASVKGLEIEGLSVNVDYIDCSRHLPDSVDICRTILVSITTPSTSFAFATKEDRSFHGDGYASDIIKVPKTLNGETLSWMVLPTADQKGSYIVTALNYARVLVENRVPAEIFNRLNLIIDPMATKTGWSQSMMLGISEKERKPNPFSR